MEERGKIKIKRAKRCTSVKGEEKAPARTSEGWKENRTCMGADGEE